jgi:hypothetical protein
MSPACVPVLGPITSREQIVRRFPRFCAPGAAAWIAVCLTVTGGVVHAQAPGTTPLERGREAWAQGDFDVAEGLFKDAISKGGLARKDVLDAYILLGATRLILKKNEPALIAFRMAGLIDMSFKTPPEAGKRASVLVDTAKKQDARIGQLQIHGEAPRTVGVGQPFTVRVTLDAGHAAIVRRVEIKVSDGLGTKSYDHDEPSATHVEFAVPGNLALADTTLLLKLIGLDAHDNQLVIGEEHVKVEATGNGVAAGTVGSTPRGPLDTSDPKKKNGDKGGGFWASPWPYVIGGAALAAGGAAVYLGTRPGDQVSVSAVRVQAIR